MVAAVVETRPSLDDDDADDPAIWVHPKDATKSLVVSTLKEGGLGCSGSILTQRKPVAIPLTEIAAARSIA